MLPKFSYIRPAVLEEAVTHLSKGDATVHAGGTDLLGCLRERIIQSGTVVSISAVDALRGIRKTGDGGLHIGALTTITELVDSEMIASMYPGLSQAAAEVASPQLRNQGTIGGNLCQKPRCWYYRGDFHCRRKGGDTCYALKGENQFHAIFGHDFSCAITHPSDIAPVLVALNGQVGVRGPKGKRTLAVEKLHVSPKQDVMRETVLEQGEILTHIRIPPLPRGAYTSYRKVRARRSWDFALAGAALVLVPEEEGRIKKAAVVLSGAAPVPWRSRAAEKVLKGKELSEATIAEAARAAIQGAEPLSDNGYKTAMFQGMLEEELYLARERLKS